MELFTGKVDNFTARDMVEVEDFLMKKLGFTGVSTHQVKESTPSDPADVD